MSELNNKNNNDIQGENPNEPDFEKETERNKAKLKFFENLQKQLNNEKKEEQECSQ